MPARPLAVVPVRAGAVPAGALEAVAEANVSGEADVVLIGSQIGSAAGNFAGVADAVLVAEVGEFAVGNWARALAPLAGAAADTTTAIVVDQCTISPVSISSIRTETSS